MRREPLIGLLIAAGVVFIALFAGYQIARGGEVRGLELALLPVMALSGLVVVKYPEYLAYVMTVIFYANVDSVASYMLDAHTSILFLMASAAFYGLLFVTRGKRPPLGTPLRLYFAFFAVIATAAALLPENNTPTYFDWLRNAIYGLNSFLLIYLLVSSPERLRTVARVVTWICIMLSVLNIIEFFDRSIVNLSPIPGRSAGLLVNPNASAAAILSGFVLSYMARMRFSLLIRFVMFVGIYTTFSRAALIMFLGFVFYTEFILDRFTWRRMVVTLLLFVSVAGAVMYWSVLMERSRNKQVAYAYNRIVAVSEGRFDDSSSIQRARVIGINFKRFLEHPVVGGRLGRTLDDDSPHNQLLFILAEHGIVGFSLFMAFLIVLYRRLVQLEPGRERRVLMSLFYFQVLYMAFTHNQYHVRFFIMNYAILAAAAEILPARGRAVFQRRVGPRQPVPMRQRPVVPPPRRLPVAVTVGKPPAREPTL